MCALLISGLCTLPGVQAATPVRPITNAETFAGAQLRFPDLFAGNPASFSVPFEGRVFDVRQYANGNHLGIADGAAYGLGPFTGQQLVRFGDLPGLTCLLKPALCPTTGGAWSTVATLSGDGAGSGRVVIDGAGHATAVWSQLEPSGIFRRSLWTSRLAAGTAAWSAPARLETSENDISDFDLAVNASGRAAVAWAEIAGTAHDVWVRTTDGAGNWSAPRVIDALDRNVAAVRIAVDGQGRSTAAWSQLETSNTWSVWSNRADAAGAWGAAVRVAPAGTTDLQAHLAVSPGGDAFLVWERAGAGLWANRAAAGAGWGTPVQLVERQTAVTVARPRVGTDAQGNALVVWSRQGPSGGQAMAQLWSRRFSGGAWNAAVPVGALFASTIAPEPRLAVNEDGAAAAAWGRADGSAWVSQTANGAVWSAATPVRGPGNGELRAVPDVGIDTARRVLVTWAASNPATGRTEVAVNRFVPDAGWSGALPAQTAAVSGGEPRVAVNADGAIVVVWTEAPSGSVIAGRRFQPEAPQ